MAHGKKIDIIFEKERVFLGEVSADSEKIKDALRILIANSITYSDSGSKVFVTIEEIEKDGGKYCRICVKDAGIGIDKNDQGLLFDKFFRAKNAVLFAPDGTGLGLYIAKYIVENHDGLIWVESELGKGSEFYIDLPI